MNLADAALGKGFIDLHGHVQYRKVQAKPQYWRISYLVHARCEFEGCSASQPGLAFDHCHQHGWIRGVLCSSHNVRLGHVEAVRALPGVRVDLTDSPFGAWIERCLDCCDWSDCFAECRHPDGRILHAV